MSQARLSTARQRCAGWLLYTRGVPVAIALVGACDRKPSANPVDQESVEVSGGKVTLGFAIGTLRKDVQVDGFRIGKYPVTRAEYAACIEADVCEAVPCAEAVALEDKQGSRPVDCVGPVSAERFCAWVSGRLPTIAEWLKAARGERPQRFAWGDAPPSCQQHPWAGTSLAARSGVAEAMFGKGAPRCSLTSDDLVVGAHPMAASPTGLQDVLLTQAELVLGLIDSPHGACSASGAGCVVYGLEGGAIDTVSDVQADGTPPSGVGFRCAWRR
jgi:formylglycine-generating enzyme required for sulfatase activity